LRIERLDGVDFEIRDVVFRGNIGNQQIDNANLSMRVDDNLFAGTFDLDVRNSPGTVSYQGTVTNLDIGGLLHKLDLVDDTDITADRVNLDYSSRGRTLREMAVNGETRAEIQNFRWLAEKQDEEKIIDLDIARLALTVAPNQPTRWEAYGSLNGVPLQAWARTAALEEILDGENKSSLTIVANSGDNFAMLNGNVDWSAPDIVSGDLVLSGERMDPEIVEFGQLESPLKGFELRTDLIINDREISATNLRASIGASHATGYARYDAGQNGKEFEVKLQAPHVQTDDFVRLADAWRNNRQGDVIVDADLTADPEARIFVDIIQDLIE